MPSVSSSSANYHNDKPHHEVPGYFTEFTFSKACLYILCLVYVSVVSTLSILQPFLFDICKGEQESLHLDFENPKYDQRLCSRRRNIHLAYLTPEECSFGRRIVIAALLGGLIGWERRSADRPAGIRTMSLVSLGACLFSICSAFAFIEGPMNWDGSRVAAAIPSGVGFLGAGIIWKQVNKDGDGHTVSGLTTAASIWLSAAVGIACSGELYFAATFSVAVMLIMLRFGPRTPSDDDQSFANSTSALFTSDDIEALKNAPGSESKYFTEYGSTVANGGNITNEELQNLKVNDISRTASPVRGSLNAMQYASHASLVSIQDNGSKRAQSVKKKKKPSLME